MPRTKRKQISPRPSPRRSKRKRRSVKRLSPKQKMEQEVERALKEIEHTEYFIMCSDEQQEVWKEFKNTLILYKDFPTEYYYNLLTELSLQLKHVPEKMQDALSELEENSSCSLYSFLFSIIWIFEHLNFSFTHDNKVYTCKDMMAIGGQSIVFNCSDSKGEYVLKMVAYDDSEIQSEIKTLKHLTKIKNVVQPITPVLKEEDGDATVYFCVFPKYGPSLSHLLKYEQFQFSDIFLKWMVRKIAVLLNKIHMKGIIHLDIHPGNILLGPYNFKQGMYEPDLYLIDFGIAEKETQQIIGMVGVEKYCSPFLDERPPSYIDDYISLIFTCLYLRDQWCGDYKERKNFLDQASWTSYPFFDKNLPF